MCTHSLGSSHAVLIKGTHDARSSTVEIPYSDIFAVARRALGLFQLTVVQTGIRANLVSKSSRVSKIGSTADTTVAQMQIFDFWGTPDVVDEVCRHLGDLVEDRRYSSIADQQTGASHLIGFTINEVANPSVHI